MADSLRDQLLKAGFVRKVEATLPKLERSVRSPGAPKPDRGNSARGKQDSRGNLSSSKPNGPQSQPQGRPDRAVAGAGARDKVKRNQEEIDLAKAYALRNRVEKEDRAREQREAEQRSREKKERKQKIMALLAGQSLNHPEADVARHFPHADKIRRVYVTADQLPQLNAGELGVVLWGGRFLLVKREIAVAVQTIDPAAVVLLCDPDAIPDDDVPDDLVW
ncbi:MAG: DUF2058 family protein [Dokdonella sp.]